MWAYVTAHRPDTGHGSVREGIQALGTLILFAVIYVLASGAAHTGVTGRDAALLAAGRTLGDVLGLDATAPSLGKSSPLQEGLPRHRDFPRGDGARRGSLSR